MKNKKTKRSIKVCQKCRFFRKVEKENGISCGCVLDCFYLIGNACYGMLNKYNYEMTELKEGCKYKLEHAVMSGLVKDIYKTQ